MHKTLFGLKRISIFLKIIVNFFSLNNLNILCWLVSLTEELSILGRLRQSVKELSLRF